MNQENWDEKLMFHNFDLGSKELFFPKDLKQEIIPVYNSNDEKISLYEMQRSAADWNWHDFSWFKEEKKYRKMIYNNPVPVYKLNRK
jgi:hypothetical protein